MSSTLTFHFAKFHPQTMAQLSSGMPYAACPTKCFVHFALELDRAYTFSLSASFTMGFSFA